MPSNEPWWRPFRSTLIRWRKSAASWDETLHSIATILRDPDHPAFQKALDFVADRGYTPNPTTGELTVRLVRERKEPASE